MPKIKDDSKVKAIHKAAMKLVIKTGFVGLRMADVAVEAGLATGTLYVYYKSKEALINDVFYETKKEVVDNILDPKHQSETFYSTFRNIWFSYFKFCFENPEKMLFCEQFLYSGYISKDLIDKVELMFEPLHQTLIDAQKNGLIKQVDVEILIAQMHGAIHEIVKILMKQKKQLGKIQLQRCFDMAWDSVKQ
ncbi:MAG: TetR/AcrR family transcriptional regulator [Bacteroidales bacterium]|nr:TetR/AcrR family transcriptional regulator [Bacteroidales bacterium]